MKIGVFDSGIGGEAVTLALKRYFTEATFITVSDEKNMPYGSKTPKQIIELSQTAIKTLVDMRCDVVVIACNTVTTIALTSLKQIYPSQMFIGIEPLVSQASELSSTHTICVCATPATLTSNRYQQIKQAAKAVDIIEPDCSEWAQMIEDNNINELRIANTLRSALSAGADVIVLGCTHYHWIQDLITRIAAGQATVLEPTKDLARRIKLVADQLPQ